ncbi:formylglycine-generating enzyme family protein [Fibrobacterota bacterium]
MRTEISKPSRRPLPVFLKSAISSLFQALTGLITLLFHVRYCHSSILNPQSSILLNQETIRFKHQSVPGFLSLILVLAAPVWADYFSIREFQTGSSLTNPPDEFINTLSGKVLKSVNISEPEIGKFYLRRKTQENEYELFEGTMKEGAYEKLYAFEIPGTRFKDRISFKYYDKPKVPWHKDLYDIYFDEFLIYVPHRAKLFYMIDGIPRRINALKEKPFLLTVFTRPPEARILVNGSYQGLSPMNISGITSLGLLLNAQKDGYYEEDAFLDLQSGKPLIKTFNLTKKFSSESPELVDLDTYLAENTANHKELNSRISLLKKELKKMEDRKQGALQKFETIYPAFTARGAYETEAAFKRRSADYLERKKNALKENEFKWELVLTKMRTALSMVQAYKTRIESPVTTASQTLDTLSRPDPPKDMVEIPAGCFKMGSENGFKDEKPVREVCLEKFLMDRTEITQADYLSMMGVNPSRFKGDKHPVERINWFDAVLYCNERSKKQGKDTVYSYSSISGKAGDGCVLKNLAYDFNKTGFRLATEAEWEYAARAQTRTAFYWGDIMHGSYAWHAGNSQAATHPVGLKKPNNWGLHDMSGNAGEWCHDWKQPDYTSLNPAGPESGSERIVRGGDWNQNDNPLRSAFRGSHFPEYRSGRIGFRTVRSGK